MRGFFKRRSAATFLVVLACILNNSIRAQSRLDVIVDERTGIRIAVPTELVGERSKPHDLGSNWSSSTGHLSIDVLNYGRTRDLSELFNAMKSRSGRVVTAQEYRNDSFYLRGNQDNGTTQIYIRMGSLDGEIRGVAIVFDSSESKRLAGIADKIISSFQPVAAATAMPSKPPQADAAAMSAPAVVAASQATGTPAPSADLPVEIVPPMPHSSAGIRSAVVSQGEDHFVASAGEDGIVKLWDVITGRLIRNVARIDTENKFWQLYQLSSDGRRLLGAVGSDVILWDTVTARELLVIKEARDNHPEMTATGSRIITRREDNSIRAFDGGLGTELRIFKGAVRIGFSSDGTHAVAAGADGSIFETDTTVGTRGRQLTTLNEPIESIQVSPNGATLAIKLASGDIFLWKFEPGKTILHLKANADSKYIYSADGNLLAFQGPEGRVEVFKTETGAKQSSFNLPRQNDVIGGFLQENTRIYLTDKTNSSAVLLNLQDGSVTDAHSTLPSGESIGSKYYLTDEDDSVMHLLSIEDGQVVRTLGGQTTTGPHAFVPSGTKVAVSTEAGPKIFDPQTGQVLTQCAPEKDSSFISTLRVSNHEQLLAHGGDKSIALCDTATGASLAGFAGHGAGMKALAFSSDDHQLLSGDANGVVKLWDVQTRRLLRTLSNGKEQREITRLAFSPDGTKLLAGTDDNKIRIWEAATGKELKTLRMLVGPIRAMAVSTDGRRVAAGPYGSLQI
jgi:WD40 repeat protein